MGKLNAGAYRGYLLLVVNSGHLCLSCKYISILFEKNPFFDYSIPPFFDLFQPQFCNSLIKYQALSILTKNFFCDTLPDAPPPLWGESNQSSVFTTQAHSKCYANQHQPQHVQSTKIATSSLFSLTFRDTLHNFVVSREFLQGRRLVLKTTSFQ